MAYTRLLIVSQIKLGITNTCGVLFTENVTMLFEQLYHKHQSNNPAEDLIKAAANGDLQKLEEMISKGTCHVSHIIYYAGFILSGVLFLWIFIFVSSY